LQVPPAKTVAPALIAGPHDVGRILNRLLAPICGLILVIGGGHPLAFAQTAERPAEADAVAPISAALCKDMKQRHVLNPGAPVGCDRLRLLKFGYIGFDGQAHGGGEMVVMDAVDDHVLQIFATLRQRGFPIARVKLMNEYNGDDDASIAQNNTSALNVRPVAGSSTISLHAFGVAIDLNPIQNPYVERAGGAIVVSPKAGAGYVNRKTVRPGMAESILDVFADHGLSVWGGDWNSPDYQHFQVSRRLAYQLARLSPADARASFERHVDRYRACLQGSAKRADAARRTCAAVD
jgi:hypothetical protein